LGKLCVNHKRSFDFGRSWKLILPQLTSFPTFKVALTT
jgi:hypothetical protein